MYQSLRPLLFKMDPEKAHELTLKALSIVGNIPPLQTLISKMYHIDTQPVEAFGLKFKNQVGLAAGYDKNGTAFRGLAALGFGHIEIGTVTPEPQTGNPKPRIFRLPEDEAIINRMGFPSLGAKYVAKQIQGNRPKDLILGVNLGKNINTPIEKAYQDYQSLIKIFSPLADYLTINISSPNTVGLRKLQSQDYLSTLLEKISQVRKKQTSQPPILIKLSPDLTASQLEDAIEIIDNSSIDGIIATNTTISRSRIISKNSLESGGLSGKPLKGKSIDVVKTIVGISNRDVIACGGISTKSDANIHLDNGAKLIQIFTGIIFQGPNLVNRLLDT